MVGDLLVPDGAVLVDHVGAGDAGQAVAGLLGAAVAVGHLAVGVGEQLDREVVAVAHLGHLPQRVRHDGEDAHVVVEPHVVGHLAERLELLGAERTPVAAVYQDDSWPVRQFVGQRDGITRGTREFELGRRIAVEAHVKEE